MGRIVLLGLLFAVLAAIPAAAVTTVVYRGQTSQSRTVRLVVNDGVLDRVYLRWVAKCRNKRFVWRDRTWFRNVPEDPIERDGNGFSDSGKSVVRFKDRTKAVYVAHLDGTFNPDNTATGTVSETVRFYGKHGKRRDYCRTPLIHFSASAG